ncbi:RusA family crossover junction endodeoxyribonuclease [Paraeggerthella sp. LCP19S3_G8]|uniref:RusA family crossover junction endodeoxyribonuclease n=1 Tax=Paraeggerthella sp. LCP19S3_G8 TaxID=3440248 RepID=UPI003F96E8EC
MIEFFAPMVPPTATHNDLVAVSDSHGKARLVKSAALKAAEAKWEAHLATFAPPAPLRGPLRADLRLCWPTDGRHPQGTPKGTKPDLDNVEKTFWDVCQKLGYFDGDQQVADKHVAKMWADPAGVYLRLEEI